MLIKYKNQPNLCFKDVDCGSQFKIGNIVYVRIQLIEIEDGLAVNAANLLNGHVNFIKDKTPVTDVNIFTLVENYCDNSEDDECY